MKKIYRCLLSLFSSLLIVYWLFVPKLALASFDSSVFGLKPNRDNPPCHDWSCANLDDFQIMLRAGIKIFAIVLGAVSVLMMVIGAFHYLTAYGNEEKAEKGKKTITWAMVGIVVTILAYVIVVWVWEITAGGVPENINANIAPPYL